ncbi:MAG: thiosulfate oxidation carrier complex protein SoxZ [bacterium]
MNFSTRLKIVDAGRAHQLMCEIRHPMESGGRKDLITGRIVPANYITQVVFRVNQEIRAELLLGKYVSRNPVVGTQIGNLDKGDLIHVSWQDIAGNSGDASKQFE